MKYSNRSQPLGLAQLISVWAINAKVVVQCLCGLYTQEIDLRICVGPFQFGIFCDSVLGNYSSTT